MVDNQFTVSSYKEALSAKLDGYPNAMAERLVLYNIVSGPEVKLKGVP